MRDIIAEINQKLTEIEVKENVTILHAVESGSRAWGFASPDSDYDVRFIYVRRKADYLKLEEIRDVIEWQLDEVLDINGWDLKKALRQFHRSNATLFEWCNSPVVYKTTEAWGQIYQEAKKYFSVKAAAYHYYGTAYSTYSQYLQAGQVNYKKYFYALRPLLAGVYLREYQCPPPVLFSELMKLDMSESLRVGINELLELKKQSDESQSGPQIAVIQQFIETELKNQKAYVDLISNDRVEAWDELNHIFVQILSLENKKLIC